MELYLIRHTQTICRKGVCYGQSDVGLLEPYDAVFEEILKQLPQEALLYSSPLLRCKILSHYILENNKANEIVEDARLMEMHFGDWELQEWSAIAQESLDPWMRDFVNVQVPNGESFVVLHSRVLSFLATLKSTEKPIIIVAHAGVIRSILCAIEGTPLEKAFDKKVDYGAVIRVEL